MSALFEMAGEEQNLLTNPATTPPSSAGDRIDATIGALTARDNWYYLQGSLRSEYDKIIKQIKDTTGEELQNPEGVYALRPDQTEYINANGQVSTIKANRMAELVRAANAARELNPEIGKPDEVEAYLRAEGDRARAKAAGLVDTGYGVTNFLASMVVGSVVDPLQALSLMVPMTKVATGGAAVLSREGIMSVGREAALQAGIAGGAAVISQYMDRQARAAGGQYVPGTKFQGQDLPPPQDDGFGWGEVLTAIAGGATFGAAFRVLQLKLLQRGKRLEEIGTPEQRLAAKADEAVELYGPNLNGTPLATDEAAKAKAITDIANGKPIDTTSARGNEPAPTSELAASLTQEELLVARAQEIGAAIAREKDPIKAAELRREAMEINRLLREAEPGNTQTTTGPGSAAGDAAPTIPPASEALPPAPSSPTARAQGDTPPGGEAPPTPSTSKARRKAVAQRVATMPDEKIETITLEANPKLKEAVDAARAKLKLAEEEYSKFNKAPDIEPEKPVLTKAQRAREAKAAKEAAEKAAEAGEVPKTETRPLTIRDVASEAQKDRLDELTFTVESTSPTSPENKAAKRELQALRQELFKEIEKQRPKEATPTVKSEAEPPPPTKEPPELKEVRRRLEKAEARLQERREIGDKTPTTKRALESAELAVDRVRVELQQMAEFLAKQNPAYAAEASLMKARNELARAEAHLKKEMASTRKSLIDEATLKTEPEITPAKAMENADAKIATKEEADHMEITQSKPTAGEIPAPAEPPKPKTEGEIKVIDDENWKSLKEEIEAGTIDPNMSVADGVALKDMIELAEIKEKEALAIVACTAGSAI